MEQKLFDSCNNENKIDSLKKLCGFVSDLVQVIDNVNVYCAGVLGLLK